MIINYFGSHCVKLQVGDLTVAINPPSKDSASKINKFGADVVLQSVLHEDMAGGKDFFYGDKVPFVISGPGEYETKELFIKGIGGKTEYDGEKMINSIYSLTVDGISILVLGAQIGELPAGLSNIIDDVDMVFVPISGKGEFSPKDAYKAAMNLGAKVIIPVDFEGAKDANLQAFLKEAGSKAEPMDKLTVKRKDIEGKEGEVMVILPQK
jgi:L-ascorbate metabolism protein UlaG (beta-lactamase superfamily)